MKNLKIGNEKLMLKKILEQNPLARPLEERFVNLASLSKKEAFLLIYKKIKKRDLFDLVQVIESIYRNENRLALLNFNIEK